jgi:hypothetical protein
MANNRLYLGNKETKEWIFVEKGWGVWWNGDKFNCDKVRAFIIYGTSEANVGDKTDLVFFTEYDECYDDFMKNGEEFDYKEFLDTQGNLIIPE